MTFSTIDELRKVTWPLSTKKTYKKNNISYALLDRAFINRVENVPNTINKDNVKIKFVSIEPTELFTRVQSS